MSENAKDLIEQMLATKNIGYKDGKFLLFHKDGIMVSMRLFVNLMKHFIDNDQELMERTMYDSIDFLIKDYKDRNVSKEAFLEMSKMVVEATGFGRPEFEFGKEDVFVRLDTNAFAETYLEIYGSSEKPICFLQKGAFNRLLDYLVESKGGLEEIECKAQGKPKCIFVRKL